MDFCATQGSSRQQSCALAALLSQLHWEPLGLSAMGGFRGNRETYTSRRGYFALANLRLSIYVVLNKDRSVLEL